MSPVTELTASAEQNTHLATHQASYGRHLNYYHKNVIVDPINVTWDENLIVFTRETPMITKRYSVGVAGGRVTLRDRGPN